MMAGGSSSATIEWTFNRVRWDPVCTAPPDMWREGDGTSPGRKALSMLNRHTLFITGASRGIGLRLPVAPRAMAPMSR